jgi:hypothetical protein
LQSCDGKRSRLKRASNAGNRQMARMFAFSHNTVGDVREQSAM